MSGVGVRDVGRESEMLRMRDARCEWCGVDGGVTEETTEEAGRRMQS